MLVRKVRKRNALVARVVLDGSILELKKNGLMGSAISCVDEGTGPLVRLILFSVM